MSSPSPILGPRRRPLIALVAGAHRVLQTDMMRQAHSRGHEDIKYAFNSVFATLSEEGSRATDMAERAGITRQSMGEIVREMVALGYLEMRTDPADRRAKLVTYTPYGLDVAREGSQHIVALEQRFAQEFGAEAYEAARDVLMRVTSLLDEVERARR